MPKLSTTLWITLAIIAIALIGFVVILRARARLRQMLTLAIDYQARFQALLRDNSSQTYEWLTLHATRMQTQMGDEGIVSFRPPFANYYIKNYPIVLNVLSELQKCLSDELLSRGNLPKQYHSLLNDALLRHQGTLTEHVRLNGQSLHNPLKWLAVGMQWLLSLPIWFMALLGIISHTSATRVQASTFFRILAGVFAAVGFISAVVGLITGWGQFLVIIRKAYPGAF